MKLFLWMAWGRHLIHCFSISVVSCLRTACWVPPRPSEPLCHRSQLACMWVSLWALSYIVLVVSPCSRLSASWFLGLYEQYWYLTPPTHLAYFLWEFLNHSETCDLSLLVNFMILSSIRQWDFDCIYIVFKDEFGEHGFFEWLFHVQDTMYQIIPDVNIG